MLDLAVIISYFNEEDSILTTIDLINCQTVKPKEVIFVNSNSDDNSSLILNNWIKNNNKNCSANYKNINVGTTNPSSSINAGISNSKTEWLAFMDCGLLFPLDWIEKQWEIISNNNYEIVSGVCLLKGEGLIDIAAVSQTYGFNRKRPCVPSTIVKKSIFDKTGLFMENRRAGYDADWPLQLKKMGIHREINWSMIITYNGVNFGSSIINIFQKSINYAIPTVGLRSYTIPYYYIIALFVFTASIIVSINLSLVLLFLYVIFRGYIIPIKKSSGIQVYKYYPIILLLSPIMGFVIDLGKIIGISIGFNRHHLQNIFKKI